MRRLVVVLAALWVGRWALLELASLIGRFWLPAEPAREPLAAPARPFARTVRPVRIGVWTRPHYGSASRRTFDGTS